MPRAQRGAGSGRRFQIVRPPCSGSSAITRLVSKTKNGVDAGSPVQSTATVPPLVSPVTIGIAALLKAARRATRRSGLDGLLAAAAGATPTPDMNPVVNRGTASAKDANRYVSHLRDPVIPAPSRSITADSADDHRYPSGTPLNLFRVPRPYVDANRHVPARLGMPSRSRSSLSSSGALPSTRTTRRATCATRSPRSSRAAPRCPSRVSVQRNPARLRRARTRHRRFLRSPTAIARTTTQPAVGQPIGIIAIPKLGVDDVVVQGYGESQLQGGPGHYPSTSLPGQAGNAAIAGHRTTFAAPFYNLNQLDPGDPIFVLTSQGLFRYDVARSEIVSPTDSAVLDASTTPELTLTTCNPRYSASQRLVVIVFLDLATPSSGTHPTTTTSPPAKTTHPRARRLRVLSHSNGRRQRRRRPRRPGAPGNSVGCRDPGRRSRAASLLEAPPPPVQMGLLRDRRADPARSPLLLLRAREPGPSRKLLTSDSLRSPGTTVTRGIREGVSSR